MALDSLPVEHVHFVFDHLNGCSSDIRNFRLVSKRYAAIGTKHLFWMARCLMLESSHAKLRDMLQGDIRHMIESMQYNVYGFAEYGTLQAWKKDVDIRPHPRDPDFDVHCYHGLPVPCSCGALHSDSEEDDFADYSDDDSDDGIDSESIGEDPQYSVSTNDRSRRFWQRRRQQPRHNLTTRSLRAHWKNYRECRAIQHSYFKLSNDADLKLFTTVLERAPKLTTLSIMTDDLNPGDWRHCQETYKKCLVTPKPRCHRTHQIGVSQLNAFLNASHLTSSRSLRSLTLAPLEWKFFMQDRVKLETWFDCLASLSTLIMFLSAGDRKHPPSMHKKFERADLSTGMMATLLGKLHKLERLVLSFDFRVGAMEAFMPTTLNDLLGDNTWPQLRSLSLDSVEARPDHLIHLIKRHSKTLTALFLRDIDLTHNASWPVVLGQMKSHTTKWEHIDFSGAFTSTSRCDEDIEDIDCLDMATEVWEVLASDDESAWDDIGPTSEEVSAYLKGATAVCPLTAENASDPDTYW